jgi:nitroreductase
MTTALEAIRARRAVKAFDPAHRFTAEEEKQLFDLAQHTPSSFNIQHWRFVKVTDPALRQKIKEAAWGQAQVADASLLLVICADVKAWDKDPVRYWKNAPEPARTQVSGMIRPFYEGKEQLQRDEAMRSVGFVAQTLMIAAKGMGYESSPMIGFDSAKVAELIKLPKDHAIGMLLAIGKGIKPANPKSGTLPLSEILVENHF